MAEVGRKPDDSRLVFELAQSYRDAGDFARACAWSERRAEMGDWDEGVSCALFQATQAQERHGEPWPAVEFARPANNGQHRPGRAGGDVSYPAGCVVAGGAIDRPP